MDDYTVSATEVEFASGETVKTVEVAAVDDSDYESAESVEVRFGSLPAGVTSGTPQGATVSLVDNDDSTETFGHTRSKDIDDLYNQADEDAGVGCQAAFCPIRYWATKSEPMGLWSDGSSLWLLSNTTTERVFGYDLATGAREPDLDFRLADADDSPGSDPPWPVDAWSDGSILYVADRNRNWIMAWSIASGSYGTYRDDLFIKTLGAAGNSAPSGMWSDGDTVWVSDRTDDKIYAYSLADGSRRADKDIDTLGSAGAGDSTALWSDGKTIWVSDHSDDKIYAFDLATGARQTSLEFDTLAAAGNHQAHAIWSDGATMWVADTIRGEHRGDVSSQKIFAYNMPVTALLSSLTVTGIDIGTFQTGINAYSAASSAAAVDVVATPAFETTTVNVSSVDGDGDTATGTSVTLTAGTNTITITTTNGSDSRTYTITITVTE